MVRVAAHVPRSPQLREALDIIEDNDRQRVSTFPAALVEPLALRTLQNMADDPALLAPPDWVLRPFFERGTLSSVYGTGKIGKSSMLADIAVHVSLGIEWASYLVDGGTVLWIDLEQGERRLLRNFQRVPGWEKANILVLSNLAVRPDYNAMIDAIELHRPALVVIDSLGKFCAVDDDNDNAAWQKALKPLEELARTHRAAFVVIDHDRKGEGEHGRAMRGASSKLAAFDTAIHVKRGNGTVRQLDVVSRETGDFTAQVERTDDGYRMAGKTPDRVLEVLREAGQPVSVEALHGMLQRKGLLMTPESVRHHLKRLVADQTAVQTGTGKKNDPKLYEARTDA